MKSITLLLLWTGGPRIVPRRGLFVGIPKWPLPQNPAPEIKGCGLPNVDKHKLPLHLIDDGTGIIVI